MICPSHSPTCYEKPNSSGAHDIFWMLWQALGGENHPQITADGWQTGDQTIKFLRTDGGRCFNVTSACRQVSFHGMGFDPEGEFTYGDTKIISREPKEFNGASYLIDCTESDTPCPFQRSETITRSQERSTSTSETIEQDLEVKAGVKGTVGGDGIGASFEASLETTWGVSDSKEKTQAEAESKSVEQTIQISHESDPGHKDLILVTTNTANTSTDFTINAAMIFDRIYVEWAYTLRLPHKGANWEYLGKGGEWVNHITDHRNRDVTVHQGEPYVMDNGPCAFPAACVDYGVVITFWGIDDMIEKMTGKSPHWPGTLNQSQSGYLRKFVERVYDRDSRFISMSGTQYRTYDELADYSFTDVTGKDTDSILDEHGMDENQVVTGGGG